MRKRKASELLEVLERIKKENPDSFDKLIIELVLNNVSPVSIIDVFVNPEFDELVIEMM